VTLAHIIRNRKTKLFKTVAALQAQHRWCLTGTPIQNSIDDLGAVVEFLRIAPFDKKSLFARTFVKPVEADQAPGWTMLTALIKAMSLRRTKESDERNLCLPSKTITLVPVVLSHRETAIYDMVKRCFVLGVGSSASTKSLFETILRLRQICNHGVDLLPQLMQEWVENALKSADIIPTDLVQIQTCESCDDIMGNAAGDGDDMLDGFLPCYHSICLTCRKSSMDSDPSYGTGCPICAESTRPTSSVDHSIDGFHTYTPSSKVKALPKNLFLAGSDSSGRPIKR